MASMIMNKKDTQTLLKNIRTAGYTVSKKASDGPMTYEVDGKQYVAIISGHSLSTFALRD